MVRDSDGNERTKDEIERKTTLKAGPEPSLEKMVQLASGSPKRTVPGTPVLPAQRRSDAAVGVPTPAPARACTP